MRFTKTGKEAGDCTTPYSVTDYKATTVQEFINEVLENFQNEWGRISVGGWFGMYPSCEYRYGKLITELPQELLDKKIKKIDSNGGWTCMDYEIYTE